MKDLYTFDITPEAAFRSYGEVTEAYRAFFDDLQLPYSVATADSGTMGGNMSHEYHFLTSQGEDNIVHCTRCDYTANEEVAERDAQIALMPRVVSDQADLGTWTGITKDKRTLIIVFFPKNTNKFNALASEEDVNPRPLVKLVPEIDLSIENPLQTWTADKSDSSDISRDILHVYDARLSSEGKARLKVTNERAWIPSDLRNVYSQAASVQEMTACDSQRTPIDLMRIKDGDPCRHCTEGRLQIRRGIEVGHTFHLGTRYSEPLNLEVSTPTQNAIHLQMGCHGIGISRLIGAVAAVMSDSRGLRWPRAIAPFDVVIIAPGNGANIEHDIKWCYDVLKDYNIKQGGNTDPRLKDESHNYEDTVDLSGDERSLKASGEELYVDPVIDDRQKEIGWKLKDADLIGYPVVVLLGKAWTKKRLAEIKCPVLGSDDLVPAEAIGERVAERLSAYSKITARRIP